MPCSFCRRKTNEDLVNFIQEKLLASMSQKPPLTNEEHKVLSPMQGDQALRRVFSDVSAEMYKYHKESNEVESVKCECCGLIEDCTPDYMGRIRNLYCGKWVCGLCSEAVKERLKRAPGTAMEEAVSCHRDFCQKFSSTTIPNPKLSLAWAMRDIAKRSSLRRGSNMFSKQKIARTNSCDHRIRL
ncbi:PREDICTED: uncharacterized protein LOC104604506 [Nelumbo nucifera]|uniref:Uncharacterized protein LOC104604506 n=1 Tax=Nelumbo nucifera TaxID=4432 RepID=A0A1U8AHP4_NELNU|nr:PREDICTED: uncharacterized protein LOC104604506 [Nelumbo nucifera]